REKVDADKSQIASRMLRLLFEREDLAVSHLGNSEIPRVRDGIEQHVRSSVRLAECARIACDAALNEVVSQIHYKSRRAKESTRRSHRVRKPTGPVLRNVRYCGAEPGAVPYR